MFDKLSSLNSVKRGNIWLENVNKNEILEILPSKCSQFLITLSMN